jgi:hypothetical protein
VKKTGTLIAIFGTTVKISFWDILSSILTAAWLIMAAAFYIIYQDPTSNFNPFPPRTPVVVTFPPDTPRTQVVLPDIWTPVPDNEGDGDSAINPGVDQTAEWQLDGDQPGIATNTPVLIITARPKTSSSNTAAGQKSSGLVLPTKNPLDPISTVDNDGQMLTVTAPVGVFDNTWQNIQGVPAFAWGTIAPDQDIDHFQLYFGTKQNGKLTIRTTKMNYSWKAVKSGIYYLRLVAVAKNGRVIGKPATFLFKYDNTPPTQPEGFVPASDGGTGYPFFEWTASTDANSGMAGGYAGYSIYQGLEKKCGKAVAFTSDTHWTPVTPVEKGTTQYFCVRAFDVVGNFTNWVGPVEYTFSN